MKEIPEVEEIKKNLYSLEKERESHKEEMTKVTEALNNNTLVIQSLRDSLEHLTNN